MNFYKRFPGDIQAKTRHLTPAEFGIYDRLLDHYYSTEQPLPGDPGRCCSITGAVRPADQPAVEMVLTEFFTEDENGRYRNVIADAAIASFRAGSKRAAWFSALPRALRTAMAAARRARLRHATPKWLNAEQHKEITTFYEKAREASQCTGIPHEVDHIVPLGSDVVCGLHVPWNLRVITAERNRSKSNLLVCQL